MRVPPRIVLSTASEDELCRLAGVGPALARRIVAWRKENGGFDSVEQLAQIKGIGRSRMEALRPYVVARAADLDSTAPLRARADWRARARSAAREPAPRPRDEVVDEPVAAAPASEPARGEAGRALAARRLPAVMDAPGSGVEPERSVGGFLRDNGLNLALVALAVVAQLLIIAVIVWLL